MATESTTTTTSGQQPIMATESTTTTTSTSSAEDPDNSHDKVLIDKGELRTIKTKNNDYKMQIHQLEYRLLQIKNHLLEERLERSKLEKEVMELKQERKEALDIEVIQKQMEDIIEKKIDENHQQLQQKIMAEVGECELQMRVNFEQELEKSRLEQHNFFQHILAITKNSEIENAPPPTSIIDPSPPAAKRTRQDYSSLKQDAGVANMAVIEVHTKKLEEIKGNMENLVTKEELKQLENLTQRIQDWVFLDGQLENVTLIRSCSNFLIKDACSKMPVDQPRGHLHAKKSFPVSVADLPSRRIFYFEVSLPNQGLFLFEGTSFNEDIYIGLSLETFGLDDCTLEFGVNSHGNYIVSGKEIARYRQGGFEGGDVIGCGLLILGESRNILFTKNGQIWVRPIPLVANALENDLSPTIIALKGLPNVETNFGADLQKSPFLFDVVNKFHVFDH